jgi:hypothetical protein
MLFAGDYVHELFVTGVAEDIDKLEKNIKFTKNTRELNVDKYKNKLVYNFVISENDMSEWLQELATSYNKLRFCLNSHQSMSDSYLKVVYDNGDEVLSLSVSRDFYFYHNNNGYKMCNIILDYMQDKPKIKHKILNRKDDIIELIDDTELLDNLNGCTEHLHNALIKKYNLMNKYWRKWKKFIKNKKLIN